MVIKTRFAPSPTGLLHVGSVRTALFSWLYARHHQGQFILRIEDTDELRSTQASTAVILAGMAWLGLDYDQGPFYQSKQLNRYQEMATWLYDQGHAYYCTCTKERLALLREKQLQAHEKPRYDGHCRDLHIAPTDKPCVLRFKNPVAGSVVFTDKVYGEIDISNSELDDLVLIRSDGIPTYNFAVVIDDWDMGITHVIRGDDHINNTPRQINIYHALQAKVPIFAHLPMILGDDGKRLSKRHGAVSVLEFKETGILPETLLNYLVRLGWSHGDKEIFSVTDMIECFNLEHINRGVASFNYEKLHWLNQHYLKSLDASKLAPLLQHHCEALCIDTHFGPDLSAVVAVQAERCHTLVEMAEKSNYFYQDELVYDEDAMKKQLRPVIFDALTMLYDRLNNQTNWTAPELHAIIIAVCHESNLGFGKIGQPLRVALTGGTTSPAIDSTLALIGKSRSLVRLANALTYIKSHMEI